MSEAEQESGAATHSGHMWFESDRDHRGTDVRAVCQCGWTSMFFGAAGLAGAEWDLHATASADVALLSEPARALTLLADIEDALDLSERALRALRPTNESVDGGAITIVVDGELDCTNNLSLRELLFSSIALHPGVTIDVNMSAVTFIDPTALGTLVAAYKRANASMGDLRITEPSSQVRAVLDITGTHRIFLPEVEIW